MLKVAIDSGPLNSAHKVRGIGSYTSELIKSLNRFRDKTISIDAIDFGYSDLKKYDVLHYTYFHPYFKTLPQEKYSYDQKIVVTVHDLIQLIYPKQYEPGFKGRVNLLKQKRALKNTDAIIVPSETSKKDAIRLLGVDHQKIKVIYEGIKDVYLKKVSVRKLNIIKKKYKLPDKFVLYVGDINYNKNIPSLIDACKIAKLPLVISGKQAKDIEMTSLLSMVEMSGPRDWYRFLFNKPHPEIAHYSEIIKRYKNTKNVYRLGFVPDEDLASVFRLSSVYCQPSLYEGFGLPVLEAMASGVPVAVSKTNALTEISGNAALVFDPEDVNDMADKLNKVTSDKDLTNKLIEKGESRVRVFSWKITASKTIETYKSLTRI